MSELEVTFDHLATDLRAAADPCKAPQMTAYMKDQFEFFGITSPERKRLQKPLLAASKTASVDAILDIADHCWDQEEREFQYVASDLLRARAKQLEPLHLPRLRVLVETKSWWDTIDALAAHPVGMLVSQFPEVGGVMDEWIDDDNMWVARVAILHQLRYKHDLDEQRLFSYVRKRCGDTEFFIRKALGWALRDYARVAPEAVRAFVLDQGDALSGLTRREAMKHL